MHFGEFYRLIPVVNTFVLVDLYFFTFVGYEVQFFEYYDCLSGEFRRIEFECRHHCGAVFFFDRHCLFHCLAYLFLSPGIDKGSDESVFLPDYEAFVFDGIYDAALLCHRTDMVFRRSVGCRCGDLSHMQRLVFVGKINVLRNEDPVAVDVLVQVIYGDYSFALIFRCVERHCVRDFSGCGFRREFLFGLGKDICHVFPRYELCEQCVLSIRCELLV